MKRKLILLAASALLLAGCGTVPSARNGRHRPVDTADSRIGPRYPDGGSRVSSLNEPLDDVVPAGGSGVQSLEAKADVKTPAANGEVGPAPGYIAGRRVIETRNLALVEQP